MTETRSVRNLTIEQELGLLRMEYERMASEIRMYVEQYSPKFNIFGVLVISAITFAWQKPDYALVYPIIPYFLFVICGVTIAQAYLITCLAERVRQIEARIADLNGGTLILTWEHVMAMKLIYPPWLKMPKKDGGVFRGPNPVFGSVVLTIIAVLPVVVFCLAKSWGVIPSPWNTVYLILTGALFAIVLWYGTSFFRLGSITSSLNYYDDQCQQSHPAVPIKPQTASLGMQRSSIRQQKEMKMEETKASDRIFGNLALSLLIAGLLGPFLITMFANADTAMGFAVVAIFLALVFGIIGRRQKTGKVTLAIGLLAIVSYTMFATFGESDAKRLFNSHQERQAIRERAKQSAVPLPSIPRTDTSKDAH